MSIFKNKLKAKLNQKNPTTASHPIIIVKSSKTKLCTQTSIQNYARILRFKNYVLQSSRLQRNTTATKILYCNLPDCSETLQR